MRRSPSVRVTSKVNSILGFVLASVVITGLVGSYREAVRQHMLNEIIVNLDHLQDAKIRWVHDHPLEKREPDVTDLVPTYTQVWPSGSVGRAIEYRANLPGQPPTFRGNNKEEFEDPVTRSSASRVISDSLITL